MRWDLEEKIEDALVSYIRGQVSGEIRVAAAWERNDDEYPACRVHCGESGPISEDAEWHDPRMFAVSVAVITEGAAKLAADNSVEETARERNAQARSEVIDALAVSDLKTQLINQGVDALGISQAQLLTSQRSTEDRYLITTLTLAVIAEPVTGS